MRKASALANYVNGLRALEINRLNGLSAQAQLSKCDLLSHMVQEFPELQGIMGRYYAQYHGEADEVAQALAEQYQPRFAGDDLPSTDTGRTLALAERLDTLLAIFSIDQAPTGTKDPFGLRRAALGVLRILIESEWNLDLKQLLQQSAQYFPADLNVPDHTDTVSDFILERLRTYYIDQGIEIDIYEAILSCKPERPLEFDKRLRALAQFRTQPEVASLAAANKRIRNILKKHRPQIIRPDMICSKSKPSTNSLNSCKY